MLIELSANLLNKQSLTIKILLKSNLHYWISLNQDHVLFNHIDAVSWSRIKGSYKTKQDYNNDYKPWKQFELRMDQAAEFCDAVKENTENFGYLGIIKLVPTTQTIDANDATIITYDYKKDII